MLRNPVTEHARKKAGTSRSGFTAGPAQRCPTMKSLIKMEGAMEFTFNLFR